MTCEQAHFSLHRVKLKGSEFGSIRYSSFFYKKMINPALQEGKRFKTVLYSLPQIVIACYNTKYFKYILVVNITVPFDTATSIYLILGNPVKHSLSPALHNAAFRDLNLNCIYLAAEVEERQIGDAVKGMRALQIAGANITSPYKEAVIPYLDLVSEEAALLQSVNTIINENGVLKGETTDGTGFFRNLTLEAKTYKPDWPVMLIGTGGAARSVAYTMALKGLRELYILNRSESRSEQLAELLDKHTPIEKPLTLGLTGDLIRETIEKSKVVLYSLPLDHGLFIETLKETCTAGKILFDFRYDPADTAVMRAFRESGGKTCNGLGMLFWQAVEAFRLFTGHEAPLKVMKRSVNYS